MISRTVTTGILGAACALFLTAAPALAQAPAASGSGARFDIEVGADAVNAVRDAGHTETFKGGWHVMSDYRVLHSVSVFAMASGDYKSESGSTIHLYDYGGGVRFDGGPARRINPFAMIFFGAAQDNGKQSGPDDHYPVFSPGGGVDIGVSKHVAVRVRVDLPFYLRFNQDVFKGTRAAIGIAFPLGQR